MKRTFHYSNNRENQNIQKKTYRSHLMIFCGYPIIFFVSMFVYKSIDSHIRQNTCTNNNNQKLYSFLIWFLLLYQGNETDGQTTQLLYLELFFPFFLSLAAVLITVVANDDGLTALFGLRTCRNLKTVHAVPRACPAAPSPAFVASAVFAPYLQNTQYQKH